MGGRDTAGRHVFNETDNETWPHALFSLRLSGRQAARSRAVPLTVPCTRLRRLSYTPQLFHHSQNSQSIYIYDREIGGKNQCLGFYFSVSKARKYTVPYPNPGPDPIQVLQDSVCALVVSHSHSLPAEGWRSQLSQHRWLVSALRLGGPAPLLTRHVTRMARCPGPASREAL